ncbi:hypothetical protein ACJX0J_026921, partial [Zea mays]
YGAEKELGANGHNLDRCDSVQEDEVSMAYMFVHMFGITLFGMAYMFVHDGLVHRCFPVGPIANVPYFRRVAAAHKGDNDYLDMVLPVDLSYLNFTLAALIDNERNQIWPVIATWHGLYCMFTFVLYINIYVDLIHLYCGFFYLLWYLELIGVLQFLIRVLFVQIPIYVQKPRITHNFLIHLCLSVCLCSLRK